MHSGVVHSAESLKYDSWHLLTTHMQFFLLMLLVLSIIVAKQAKRAASLVAKEAEFRSTDALIVY